MVGFCCKSLDSTLDIGVKIIVGRIHELSLQGFGGYTHYNYHQIFIAGDS